MLQQLDPPGGSRQGLDLPSLRSAFRQFLTEAPTGDGTGIRPLLIDGLDEVSGWSPADYLSIYLPHVHVIVSIRDTGQDWREIYRLLAKYLTVLPLDGFDQDSVTAVFTATGGHAADLIHQSGALEAIMSKATYTSLSRLHTDGSAVHGADPLYIRFLAEDSNDATATLRDLKEQPAGFTGYLERWWQELKRVAGDVPVQKLLAVLAAAEGPLTRTDLEAILPELFRGWVGDTFDDEVLPKIRRMVSGSDTMGYAFSHPRLRHHLLTPKHIPKGDVSNARRDLLGLCRHWKDQNSLYALAHYPSHLAELEPSDLPHLYSDAAYLEAAVRSLGIDRVIGTLKKVLSNDLPRDLQYDLQRCLRPLERESHRLRDVSLLATPGYAARQLGLQALASGWERLAESAHHYLLSLPSGQLIPVWSTNKISQALVRTLEGHSGLVDVVAITGDGSRAVTAGNDRTARIWDLTTGTELHTLGAKTGWNWVNAVAITPDGTRAVTASSDHTARIWELTTATELHKFKGHNGAVNAVAITADGTRAVTASSDHTARIWDLATATELHTFKGHKGTVNAVAITADGTRAVTASSDETARIWDLATGVELHTLKGHAGWVDAVAITPDGTRAITAGNDRTARMWDMASGVELHTLKGHKDVVNAVAITADGTRAVTAGNDGTARLWDLAKGEELHTLKGHTGAVNDVAITADGTRAVTAGNDGTARLWDLATGEELHTLKGHTGAVRRVAITPDGTRAVTAGNDGTARLWDLAKGEELHTLKGHTGTVRSVAITPDGTRAATTGNDATARLWDLATGKELHTLKGHTGAVRTVAITPDGTRAVTAGRDDTARLWDLTTGMQLQTVATTSSMSCLQIGQDRTTTTIVVGETSGAITTFQSKAD
ncbi:hypothetical protein BMF89_00200 [Arthrobacter sp. SRS-W-1-2016]|uniref:WD40 repeat domain-containing protein n=1 Tax=Arthrobacter sp. SRS-W-1-2016 TaxID=1930254 RepID=UPI0009D210A6|nr:WD40 repeat domain-containing protein [Arthrobacter sp. SRS-W-1-2016]OOP65306.1 hypothetical protein BMF89_00200 [Arthrobacter sp. SRS-W-1-2016]